MWLPNCQSVANKNTSGNVNTMLAGLLLDSFAMLSTFGAVWGGLGSKHNTPNTVSSQVALMSLDFFGWLWPLGVRLSTGDESY